MARPASAGGAGDHHSIQMPTVTATGDDGTQRSAPEETLNRFVRYVAFLEWTGNAFGLLSFTWATVVLLSGYTSLNKDDLWFATVIIFIETFRVFSRGYKLDNCSLFGTTSAVTSMSSAFARRLASPQGNEVVLIMGLWNDLVYQVTTICLRSLGVYGGTMTGVFNVALLIVLSKLVLRGSPQMDKGPRRRRQLQLCAVLIAFLPMAAYTSRTDPKLGLAVDIADMVTMVVAVLLLNMRPRCIGKRITSPCGRRLVSLAKFISALWLPAFCLVQFESLLDYHSLIDNNLWWNLFYLSVPFTTVVLSLGSLQDQIPSRDTGLIDPAINVMMHILYLWSMIIPIPPFFFDYWAFASAPLNIGSSMVFLAVLLFGNLQIPVAAMQLLISFGQLHRLLRLVPDDGPDRNVLPAVSVFYFLALSQGALYIMACIIGLFSFFPRRLLVRRLNLSGQRAAKAIALYYQDAYATRMKIGVVSAGENRISLARFAMHSLCSSSSEMQLAGLIVLEKQLLQESHSSKMLMSRITSSDKEVSTLIAMLSWTAKQDREIRLFAARVTTMLAPSLRVIRFPGMVSMVSSLLDAENSNQQPAEQDLSLACAKTLVQQGEATNADHSWSCRVWVRRCRQRMEDKWSIPKETPSTHQNSCPRVLGLIILEKLAHDYENCGEIFKATNLISKIIGLLTFSSTHDNQSSEEDPQQYAVICSSLDFVRRLAITGEEIGLNIRQELQKNPFLLNNIAGILDDPRSSPQLWTPAMDIIAKLLLHKGAGKEIGRTKGIIGKLMHSFLGRYGPASMDDDVQSLRMVAGDALANHTIWGTQNCTAILEEPGYQVIKDLNDLIRENDYRYAAATVLQNLCVHCRVKLMSLPDASDHLSSTLTTVMGLTMEAEGKQLESLIGLATQIADVIREPFVREVESQPNSGADLVQKLVRTLNASKIPNPEHPRMRRVIVKIMITILSTCPDMVKKLMEKDMMEELMEALNKIDRTPSKVENYRLFYGNKGVVPENEEPMTILVARAKGLIK